MPKHKYFSSDVIFNQSFENIDSAKGIISGVKVCSEGEAQGHGVWLNKKFIRDVTRFGKDHTPGVKARFGHPNMCATALGTYLGRYKNFRTQTEEREDWEEGKRYHTVADLHLDETSKNLPKLGNAWEYIIKLAQTSPNMFGNSIVFTPGDTEEKKSKNDDGSETTRYDATIEQLHATDLVDEPAATEGLFERFEEDDLAMQMTTFLDQHPEVYKLAMNNPEIVESFLKKYESYKTRNLKSEDMDNKTLFENLKTFLTDLFLGKKKEDGTEGEMPKEITDKLTEFETSLNALSEENEALKTELQAEKDAKLTAETTAKVDYEAKEKDYQAKITTLESQITRLQADPTKPKGIIGAEDPEKTEDPKMKEWNELAAGMKKFEVHDEKPDLNEKMKVK